jgi:hypothetical protein
MKQAKLIILVVIYSVVFIKETKALDYASYAAYGNPWNAYALTNLELRGNIQVSYRFRAEHSSLINAVRVMFVYRSGYGAGNGGDILVELRTDDGTPNHNPSETVLTSHIIWEPMTAGFPLITFDTTGQVQEGEIYHIVFTNIDSNSSTNWVSLDCLFNQASGDISPVVPRTDWATIWTLSGSWAYEGRAIPILEIRYIDGYVQGLGYHEGWPQYSIGGNNRVREVFTVSGGDKIVSDVNIRVAKSSGSGDLTVRLEDSAGTLIEEGTISSSSISNTLNWVKYNFITGRKLKNGQGYNLVLSSSGGSYTAVSMQESTSYGFSSSSEFSDGILQTTSGSSWQTASSDIQFYFTLSGISSPPPQDSEQPTTPTNLTATPFSSFNINLSWNNSTDNIGVAGYKIYRNGTQIGTSTTTIYSDVDLSPSTTYIYTVSAYDAAGNESNQSTQALATTQARGKPAYTILKTTISPTIDGNLSEYTSANSLTFSPSTGGNIATVKALWDSEALYLGFKLTDTQLNAFITTRDSGWNEDAIEWFIDTLNNSGGSANPNSAYMLSDDYQGIVNILNTQYDLQGTTSGSPSSSWNGTWQSTVSIDGTNNNNTDTDTGYTVEIKIPWTSIGYSSAPRDDTVVGMSFAVNDKDVSLFSNIMWPNITSFQNASNWQEVLLSGSSVPSDNIPPSPPRNFIIK